MKEAATAQAIDPIREEREYFRGIFWAAYQLFQMKSVASTPAMLPDGTYSQPGGPHDPSWEKWSMWRADFHLCGKQHLSGIEEEIFSLHFCMGLPERAVIKFCELGSYNELNGYRNMIAEKMGHHLDEHGLWPISAYIDEK